MQRAIVIVMIANRFLRIFGSSWSYRNCILRRAISRRGIILRDARPRGIAAAVRIPVITCVVCEMIGAVVIIIIGMVEVGRDGRDGDIGKQFRMRIVGETELMLIGVGCR